MAAKLAGGAPRRYDLGQNADINVTPFVDVMLVLLIIFMVTAPLATTTLQLQLPRSGSTAHPATPIVVGLTADGQIYISTSADQLKRTTLDALAADLAPLSDTSAQIFIRADKRVPYGRFVAVMDRLRSAGYVKVGLVAEEA
jgi:biopolymer transport protein ExbD